MTDVRVEAVGHESRAGTCALRPPPVANEHFYVKTFLVCFLAYLLLTRLLFVLIGYLRD